MDSLSASPVAAAPGAENSPDDAQACGRAGMAVSEQLDAAAAARLLRDRNVRWLMVTDRRRQNVIGVLTPRDMVIAVVAREADPRSLRVGDMMRRLDAPLPLERALRELAEP